MVKMFTVFTLKICLSKTMEEKDISISQKSMEASWVQNEMARHQRVNVELSE